MMVSEYATYGDLCQYLKKNKNMRWCDKLFILRDIAKGIAVIYDTGLVHGDLYTGNILHTDNRKVKTTGKVKTYDHKETYEKYRNSKEYKMALVSNIGPMFREEFYEKLRRKEREEPKEPEEPRIKNSNLRVSSSTLHNLPKIYGVIPYMAPEVFCHRKYTNASDVYSFAMIMSEVASGNPPFAERCHDAYLILDVIDGVRPNVSGPKCFIKLMERPNIKEVYDLLQKWAENLVTEDKRFTVNQFLHADHQVEKEKQLHSDDIHNGAIYTSRPLTQYITRELHDILQKWADDPVTKD
ncbi:17451_t:CDS:2, partial [Racocetra fulgida]